MTCDELKAAINSEIAQNARIAAIRSRMDAGTADFLDSELYTAITAEITAEQMRRNVLALSDREPAFVDVVRERYTDTFDTFNAVQRILDALTGIRIRTVQPEFENDRAHKIGHSLNDPTVPESVIERRAYSATENFVRSQHDRCTKANASFRSRAGLDCRITRTGGAKCCDWCASVSGSFTAGNAPDGIWGRHDNCKCSITYETRRGSFQQLSGSGKGWDTVEELPENPLHVFTGETTGAGEVHAVSGGLAAAISEIMQRNDLTSYGVSATIEAGTIAGKFKNYVPPREERIAIIKRGIECEKPVFDDGALAANYRYVDKLPDYYDVVMHGTPNAVSFFGTLIDYQTLGAIIMGRDDYKRGTKIRLISCDTGKGSECVAEYLSKMLGVEVLAPTEKVTLTMPIGNKSRMVVESDKHLHDGEWKPFGRKEKKEGEEK